MRIMVIMMINDNGHDGVHDHTQNCEMTDFHIDIEKNVEEQIGPISS